MPQYGKPGRTARSGGGGSKLATEKNWIQTDLDRTPPATRAPANPELSEQELRDRHVKRGQINRAITDEEFEAKKLLSGSHLRMDQVEARRKRLKEFRAGDRFIG